MSKDAAVSQDNFISLPLQPKYINTKIPITP